MWLLHNLKSKVHWRVSLLKRQLVDWLGVTIIYVMQLGEWGRACVMTWRNEWMNRLRLTKPTITYFSSRKVFQTKCESKTKRKQSFKLCSFGKFKFQDEIYHFYLSLWMGPLQLKFRAWWIPSLDHKHEMSKG